MSLDLDTLRSANLSRCRRWHPGWPHGGWTGADWSNALAGEVGEAANVVKKLRRWDTGAANEGDPDEITLLEMLRAELADIACYLDLLAAFYGINLSDAIRAKFNVVSERQGFPERL